MSRISKRRLFAALGLSAGLALREPLSLSPYSAWVISLPLVFWCGAPFHAGWKRSLKEKRADTDMLVSISLWAAFLYTTAAQFAPSFLPDGSPDGLFGTLAALVILPSAGRLAESWMVEPGGEAVWKLTRRIPATARVLRGGRGVSVPSAEVEVGERVLVRPGEQIPLDGVVAEGASTVDESLWTGIEAPVEKAVASRLLGGSVNKSGELVLMVGHSGPATTLARLVGSVREGFRSKRGGPGIAASITEFYVPAVVIAGGVAAVLWALEGTEPRNAHALTALVFTLAAATPWTVGLAAPAALAAGLRRAGRMGLKIRNPEVLQSSKLPDFMVVDKTGILTVGRPELSEVVCFGDWTEESLVRTALAAGGRSGHPYAEALTRRAAALGKPDTVPEGSPKVSSIEIYPGHGVSAWVGDRRVLAGSLPWLAEKAGEFDELSEEAFGGRAEPILGVIVDGVPAGALVFYDPIRPGTVGLIADLKRMGVEVVLASGDRAATVRSVAREVGIERVYPEVSAGDKVRIVNDLRVGGARVAMAGEGFLDAPALSHSDLGFALDPAVGNGESRASRDGAAFDLSVESADLVLNRRDLAAFIGALRLAARIRSAIRENLLWAFGVQAAVLPVAAGALIPGFGVGYAPAYSAAAAAVSLAAITLNSIRRLKI